MSRRKVVVTGLGMVSPLGNTVESTWSNLIAGKSGIGPITSFDVKSYSTRFGGSIKDLDVDKYIPTKDSRKMDPFIQYGLIAGIQAIDDSGLQITDSNRHRIGAAIGSGIGGMGSIENTRDLINERGPKRISPFFVASAKITVLSLSASALIF